MRGYDTTTVLDIDQLRSITFGDGEMMREILAALIEDTERQLPPLEAAIRTHDGELAARLAHYCKGACANVGCNSIASLLKTIERHALSGEFETCAASFEKLPGELMGLRKEAEAIPNR